MTSSRQCKRAYLPVRWRALVVLCFSCLVTPVFAVTLGQATILSLLGDPIEVEIEVLQWDDIDLGRVQVSLASEAEYTSFDLAVLPVLDQLTFNLVGPNSRGEVKVLVSTREPVAEPFVELLLVMRWPGGALLREFVLLFDLPPSPERSAAAPNATVPNGPVGADPVQTSAVVQRLEETASKVVDVEPEPIAPALMPEPEPVDAPQPRNQGAIVVETIVAAATTVPPATGRRVYQVREGDGLWSIAQQFQPAGVGENIYQMLLSLHDLNRAAFINGNISLLKANALLQIPDADDIVGVDAASAELRFEQRWDEGTVRLQTALRGDPLPAFSDLYEDGNIEAGPQAEIEARSPGEETGRVSPGGSGLLLPAMTPVVVPIGDVPAASDGGDLLLGEQELQQVSATSSVAAGTSPLARAASAATAAQGATINPHLDRINALTREFQASSQNRSVQIASLETQLVVMRQRMRDAQQVTARLNQALEQALARRSEQQAAATRNSTVPGLVALVLLVALVVAIVVLVKLTVKARSQHRLLDGDGEFADSLDPVRPVEAGVTQRGRSSVLTGQSGQDTGIFVEEVGMSASADGEGIR